MKKESARKPRTPAHRLTMVDAPVCVDTRGESARRNKKEFSGWLSSIAVHLALLVVIGLLLAPADFGGRDTVVLLLDLKRSDEQEIAALDVAFTADDSLSSSDASAPRAVGVELFGSALSDATGTQAKFAPGIQWGAAASLGAAGRPC